MIVCVCWGGGATCSILFGSRNKVSDFCKVAVLALHVQLNLSFPSKGSACMLELKFAHDYQAAIYDWFVLTVFKAGTEESASEQVFVSICILLLFGRSAGTSLFVLWVLGVLIKNTSTNPWVDTSHGRTEVWVTSLFSQSLIKTNQTKYIYLGCYWPKLNLDQQ